MMGLAEYVMHLIKEEKLTDFARLFGKEYKRPILERQSKELL
ncbi:hypothetical protein [Wolbachia endosymbiont of Litomosoides sigmodontis]|nr:hypothetical protein [Wolbachia endosymbiont of Litomosoides sigmodontis]